jgi:hypothetical protein
VIPPQPQSQSRVRDDRRHMSFAVQAPGARLEDAM